MSDTNLTISTNSLSQTLDVHQITPEYFILHYAEFIRRVVAKGNPSDDTMRHYCNQIDFFIRWCLSHERNPLAMNEYQLIMYREFLLNRQYKADSIQVMLVAVKAFYAAAKKVGLIGINPATELEAPSIGSNSEALLHYYTPQQMNEIVHVFDEDTNFFTRYRNTLILYLMGVEGLKDGVLTPLILSSSNRNLMGRISRNGIRSIMNKALTACDLKHPGYSCHVFRHSCGTNLYKETKDLRLVQDTLRHRDPKITARYAHVADRLSKRYTSKLVPHD